MMALTDKQISRFWSKVAITANPDKCWQWQAGKSDEGYGSFKVAGKVVGAHRVSFVIANGAITGGLFVLHSCDNRGCVNPKHLFLGTNTDNMRDKVKKGRSNPPGLSGEKHGMHKLTGEQVRYIREQYTKGNFSQSELARRMNITISTIHLIVHGKTWRTV